jgi:hypothetical protein
VTDPVIALLREQPHTPLALIGCGSNMGAILDLAVTTADEHDWSPLAIDLLRRECFASTYNEFLVLLMDVFDIIIPEKS